MSPEKQALLDALNAERMDNRWWNNATEAAHRTPADDDITTARRRRDAAEEWAEHEEREKGHVDQGR